MREILKQLQNSQQHAYTKYYKGTFKVKAHDQKSIKIEKYAC
jgi:hypothetical protein